MNLDKNIPQSEDTNTPTSQWGAPHVWWIDANDSSLISTSSPRSGVTTRQQSSEAGREQIPVQHVDRDARCVFGDLPNSSYAPEGVFGDPIERELRRRSADQRLPSERGTTLVEPTRRADSSAAVVDQPVGVVVVPRTETAVADVDTDFWREKCRRLQVEVDTLAGERDRYMQLAAYNIQTTDAAA